MSRSPRFLLLPTWIRVFSWIFLVIGVGCVSIEVGGMLFNISGNFMLHGLRYAGPLRHLTPAAMSLVFAFYGYAAYRLLWGKKDGRQAGVIAGYLGMGLCVLAVLVSLDRGHLYIPLEPLLQVPFVLTLHRLKGRWEQETGEPTPAPSGEAVRS